MQLNFGWIIQFNAVLNYSLHCTFASLIVMPNKVFKIREIGNESHIQEINIKFVKPCKASAYMMVMNWVMDNPHVRSDHIVKCIQWRKLTPTLLKCKTPSSKRRQLLWIFVSFLNYSFKHSSSASLHTVLHKTQAEKIDYINMW